MASRIVTFDGLVCDALGEDNYDKWKVEVQHVLKDVWGHVSGELRRPENPREGHLWDKKDHEAICELIAQIEPSQLKHIAGCRSSHEIWKKLESVHSPEDISTPKVTGTKPKMGFRRNFIPPAGITKDKSTPNVMGKNSNMGNDRNVVDSATSSKSYPTPNVVGYKDNTANKRNVIDSAVTSRGKYTPNVMRTKLNMGNGRNVIDSAASTEQKSSPNVTGTKTMIWNDRGVIDSAGTSRGKSTPTVMETKFNIGNGRNVIDPATTSRGKSTPNVMGTKCKMGNGRNVIAAAGSIENISSPNVMGTKSNIDNDKNVIDSAASSKDKYTQKVVGTKDNIANDTNVIDSAASLENKSTPNNIGPTENVSNDRNVMDSAASLENEPTPNVIGPEDISNHRNVTDSAGSIEDISTPNIIGPEDISNDRNVIDSTGPQNDNSTPNVISHKDHIVNHRNVIDSATSTQGNPWPNAIKSKYNYDNGKNKSNSGDLLPVSCIKFWAKGHKAAVRNTNQYAPNLTKTPTCPEETVVYQKFESSRESVWCLDSGCTSHMTNDTTILKGLIPVEGTIVNLATSASTVIEGKGTASLQFKDGCEVLTLFNTLYVSDLRTNLLSVGALTDIGYRINFIKGEARVMDDNGAIKFVAIRAKDGLYYVRCTVRLEEPPTVDTTFMTIKLTDTQLWHRRFGHLNEFDLKSLLNFNLVLGIKPKYYPDLGDCEICARVRLTPIMLPISATRETEFLKIVHIGVCGPLRVTTPTGQKYFVTFTDDSTRWCEVVFVRKKTDALNAFISFKSFAEKISERRIKYIETDGDDVFRSEEFQSYFLRSGLRLQTSVSQGSVAKWSNRSLLDTATCMLLDSNLPEPLWAEAVRTANHIRNRSPSSSIGGETPYRLWKGQRPSVNYFRAFGTEGYVLNRQPTGDLMDTACDERAEKCYLLGYTESLRAYRVWISRTQSIQTTRDVKFIDEKIRRVHHGARRYSVPEPYSLIYETHRSTNEVETHKAIGIFPTMCE